MAIGVAVSNSPYGPFVDAIGKPLISRSNPGDYDPTVFVDDDGQAYLYWGGNGPCYYVKLNEDMISTWVKSKLHLSTLPELLQKHLTQKDRGYGRRITFTTWHGLPVAAPKVLVTQ